MTDEGPMRRELMRQIARLEAAKVRFEVDNSPWEPIPSSPQRGPAQLSTAELEQIRDELLAAQQALYERTVARATSELFDDAEDNRMRTRLRRLLRRTRERWGGRR